MILFKIVYIYIGDFIMPKLNYKILYNILKFFNKLHFFLYLLEMVYKIY